ncbi:MAG: gliding motility-associated ABC transporter permease subunit GldF [Bacteroidales bacterium]|jgi:ABC-2 type transport system permease protein|nr:gliding motility-associated ABC transporter permease subunit GldF [Bacteroidales bacterium]
MYSLFVKEIKVFLNSLIGYFVIGVFLTLTGLFLWIFPMSYNVLDRGFADVNGLFSLAPIVFLLLVPAITMRSFAEEKRVGTIEILLTMPLSYTEVILSKYLASVVLVVISVLPTFIYFLSIYFLGYPKGNIDFGAMWGSYLGLILLGAAFASIGVFCSLLTDSQIVSFILSMLICFLLWMGFDFIYSFDIFGSFGQVIKWFGIDHHYASISRGVVDTRDIIYFLSVIILFLCFSRLRLQSRKW